MLTGSCRNLIYYYYKQNISIPLTNYTRITWICKTEINLNQSCGLRTILVGYFGQVDVTDSLKAFNMANKKNGYLKHLHGSVF